MKAQILIILTVCFCSLNSTIAQTNLGFETWGNDGFGTNNPLGWATFNYDSAFGSPVSTFQETTDPGELLSSAKMVTTAGYAPSLGAFGFPDVCGGFLQQLAPYALLPTSIDFMYKSNIVVGDTGLFLSQLTHWDGTQTVVDGFAFMQFAGSAVTTWTPVSLPYTYLTSDKPDSVAILAISSQELVLTLPVAVAGSELQLDDIVLNTGGAPCSSPTASFTSSSVSLLATFIDGSTTTGNVTYTWDFGDSFGTSTLQNPSYTYAAAGTYNVCLTVDDSCGTNQFCQNVTVTSTGGCNLTVTATSTDESAAGMNDGTGTAFASNGTPPYNYMWSDGQTTAIATTLAPGTYTVTVIDADSCIAIGTVSIAAGAVNCQIQITIIVTDETGSGANDGTAVAVVTDGTQPYIYLWSTGATTSSISGLSPGIYTCTVVDADTCTTGGTGVVQAFPCTLTGTMASTDETSLGAMDGSAAVSVSGGTGPYTYVWSNLATTSSISGLAPGIYDVAVTDANGCTYNASAAVNVGGLGCALSASVTGTGESQSGANDGTVSVTTSGGTAPISVTWDTGDTISTISNLAPGDYTVVLVDAMGCIATATYTVSAGLIIGVTERTVSAVSVHVYPNPASGFVNFEIKGGDRAMLYVFDLAGGQVKEIAINQMLTEISTTDLNNGIYFYQLIGANSDHLGSGKFVISK